MSKKGFTLIELLAVIVVLSIIASIAIPIVINSLDSANKGALVNSGYGLIKAAEEACVSKWVGDFNDDSVHFYDFEYLDYEGLNFKGKAPTGGGIYVDENCEIYLGIYTDKWCLTNVSPETFIVTDELNIYDYKSGNCIEPVDNPGIIVSLEPLTSLTDCFGGGIPEQLFSSFLDKAPRFVTANFDNGSSGKIYIDWINNFVGEYPMAASGNLILPDGVTNPSNLKADILIYSQC